MDPNTHDPNNHAPEVSPEDDWGDVELTEEEQLEARKKLPKRRNDAMRRPKMLQVRETESEPETVRVIPELDEDDFPIIERLEVAEDPNTARSKRRSRQDPEDDEAPRRVEPSGVAKHLPAENTARREGDQWGGQQTHSVRWMIIAAVSILVILVAAISVRPFLTKRSASEGPVADFSRVLVDQPQIIYDPAEFDMGGNTVAEAKEIFRSYAKAKSLDEVLPVIRDHERLEPILREQWRPLGLADDWTIPDSTEWTLRKVDGRDFACLSGPFPSGAAFQYYFIREEGKLLIDWEASVGYGYKSFEELAKGGDSGGIIRAEISVNDMYTFTVPDELYVSLKMIGPDRESLLWGYLKRGTEAEDQIRRLFQPGFISGDRRNEYRVTVRIEPPPPDSLPNQWIIAEFLHIDWLTP